MGWAIATIMANIVWCLPQFSLGTAAVTQNLLPELNNTGGKVLICAFMLGTAFLVVRAYDKGSTGVKIFDLILKIMVGIVVISFFGVVIKLSTGQANWNEIVGICTEFLALLTLLMFTYLSSNKQRIQKFLGRKNCWTTTGCHDSAAATAVGINMTFLCLLSFSVESGDASTGVLLNLTYGLHYLFPILWPLVV